MTVRVQKLLLVLGAVMLVGVVLAGLILGKAVSALQTVQRIGNETATIQNLKTIALVESQYFYSHRRTFGTFEHLVAEQMLSAKFAGNPVKTDGYVLTLTVTSEPAAYTITADPASAREGARHFYLDSVSREIHVNSDKPAGPNDPIVKK